MTTPAIVNELLRLATLHGASNEARAYLAALKRTASALVFGDAGADAAGDQLIIVGDSDRPDTLVTFSPKHEGVVWWQRAVMSQPLGVVVPDRAPDTARRLLQRALDELDDVCPRLASELRRNSNRGANGMAIYRMAVNSPRIVSACPE